MVGKADSDTLTNQLVDFLMGETDGRDFYLNLSQFCHCNPSTTTHRIPQEVLTSCQKVYECKGLQLVHSSGQLEPYLTLKLPSSSNRKCLPSVEK